MTGENLPLVKLFLNLLRPRFTPTDDAPAEFQIDDSFNVPVRRCRCEAALSVGRAWARW